MRDNRAACAGKHQLFESTEPHHHAQAKAICATCPVLATCRDTLAQEKAEGTYLYTGTRAGQGFGIRRHSSICGTIEGWRTHRQHHTPICGPCTDAYNTHRDQQDRETREQLGTFRQRSLTYGQPSRNIGPAIQYAAQIYDVNPADVEGRRGDARVRAARRTACVAATTLGDSYISIARALNRDHSTVITAVKRATQTEHDHATEVAARLRSTRAAA